MFLNPLETGTCYVNVCIVCCLLPIDTINNFQDLKKILYIFENRFHRYYMYSNTFSKVTYPAT